MYLYERENWTDFRWDDRQIGVLLDEVCRQLGRLYGRLGQLGFDSRLKAMAENLAHDVVFSSEIEGVKLNVNDVRSSIARRLGIENVQQTAPSHYVDAVVKVMLEAMEHYDQELTKEKLCAWQSAFFPTGYSEGARIEVGCYRTHEEHIVSGFLGRERVHYVAPSPQKVEGEMAAFIRWFNSGESLSPIIRSAIAHLWFVSIHPFEDGNGRLARILSDMFLARGDNSRFRFYNMSAEINRDKKHYYDVLERTQRGDGDITDWLTWYLKALQVSVEEAESRMSATLNKSLFWMRMANVPLTERQVKTLNLFLDGYEAKLTSKSWAALNKCSRDTANRDLQDLLAKGVVRENVPGAKRPSYAICYLETEDEKLNHLFRDVHIEKSDSTTYLQAVCRGNIVRERITTLDAECYQKGDIPLDSLLSKYFAYMVGER